MKPKPIAIRYKLASGKKAQVIFEELVYLEVLDLSKQEVNKCVFMIDIEKKYGNKNEGNR